MKVKEKLSDTVFRFGVGILTLSMYKKLIDHSEKESSGRQEEYDADVVFAPGLIRSCGSCG